ncbi:hypothetical protein B0H16DRAFT_1713489 [Mycena metata]|uniref:Ribonuclease H1 N-terminal domain-containing protein n=1 Tax=Mycena metata TaxID=1033252 RepID=A0AAD7HG61_9AGAR|nr:hypothetical protein B0H16DRAFT_1474610 [Mycena metata]KAJ7775046.1 hypothetical protein B0H16DRAFT_1713489 [Mycena metata]
MVHNGPPCHPPFFDHGRSHTVQDQESNLSYYVVVIGRTPGIYFERREAEAQVLGCHNQKWQGFATEVEARAFWDEWCRRLHNHRASSYKVWGLPGKFNTYDEAMAAAANAYITQA